MRNKIWVSLIILIIATITISCKNEIEKNTVGSKMGFNDDVKNDSEDDMEEDSEDDFEDELDYTTDEYFIKKNSVYRNPIEQYYWSKLNSKDKSEKEHRKVQKDYQKAWKAEYQNLIKWMKEKCVYNEDKNNLSLLEKSVADQIDREKKVLGTDLTNDCLTQIEGELYRDVCMRILDIAGYEDYKFKFSKSGGELVYTDENFIKKYSIYRNPIDQSFLSKLNSWGESQVEYRQAQRDYQKVWKAEFQNLMKWMKKKCVYDEDKNDFSLLEKSVADQVDREKTVLKTDLIGAYKIDPDFSKAKNSVSRSSYMGNGTNDRLTEMEGRLYRDVCMRILNLVGYDEYEFKFRETD